MPDNPNIHLFAGPTLYKADGSRIELPKEFRVHPPATRGDILPLLSSCASGNGGRKGTIILVDGVFQQRLAVGHIELRTALDEDWEVYGLASMGAIRAYEMRRLGMQGYGCIYRMFETEVDFQDDEVALLHAPDPPYRPSSEPLVHCRVALNAWVHKGLISPTTALTVVENLKALWFGERTLARFRNLLAAASTPEQAAQLESEWAHFDVYRQKTIDLQEFVRMRLWEVKSLHSKNVP